MRLLGALESRFKWDRRTGILIDKNRAVGESSIFGFHKKSLLRIWDVAGQRLAMVLQEIGANVSNWIETNLGSSYPWHGNIRELEQCVRSFLIREEYVPLNLEKRAAASGDFPTWLHPVVGGELSAEELLSRYCTFIYSKRGSYEQTAQILKLDRRTVKAKIDQDLLKELADR